LGFDGAFSDAHVVIMAGAIVAPLLMLNPINRQIKISKEISIKSQEKCWCSQNKIEEKGDANKNKQNKIEM